ncbi:MAG: hypothetical protein ACRCYY_13565 [Trueperaceae bacterium]
MINERSSPLTLTLASGAPGGDLSQPDVALFADFWGVGISAGRAVLGACGLEVIGGLEVVGCGAVTRGAQAESKIKINTKLARALML